MRITYKRVIVFLVILGAVVSFQGGLDVFLKLSDKQTLRQSHRDQKHVLLLATTRTGSSFVGEFFNQQRDNMSYLYEPLWHVERTLTLDGKINVAAARVYPEVLRQLFQCNFSLLETFMRPHPADHITRSFFRRDSSGFLCEEPVCSPAIKGLFESHRCRTRACGPLNLTKASESCLQKKHRVIKVVRVHHFHVLQPLAEDTSLDLKFIQLVRDPRATISSRMKAFGRYETLRKWTAGEAQPFMESDLKKLKTSCDTVRTSAELGLSQPPWLHGRYMLVRYEDVARSPIQKATEMYQFSGIPFTPRTKSWISMSTSKEASDAYSTQKNSSEHIDTWRFRLPFKLVEVIQKICEPTMRLFGYKFVTSEKMLNDTSISLVENKDFSILWKKNEIDSQ